MKFWWDINRERLIFDMKNTITFNKNEFGIFMDKSLDYNKVPFTLQNGYTFHVDERKSKLKSFYKCAKELWKFL